MGDLADVRAFRGYRYGEGAAGSLSLNLCPPRDVITTALGDELHRRSPYNVVRLEVGQERPSDGADDNRFIRARRTLAEWIDSGVLRRDDEPSLYVVEQSFSFRGRDHVRREVIGAVRMEEYDRGVVLPHEFTRRDLLVERLEMLKETRANYSALMILCRDPDRRVCDIIDTAAGREPDAMADPPGLPTLRMWRVSDPAEVREVSAALAGSPLYIADGHHRYEAAMSYRDLVRGSNPVGPDDAINFRMMALVPMNGSGLLVLGYHRTLHSTTEEERAAFTAHLRAAFDLERFSGPAHALEEELAARPRESVVYGIAGLEPDTLHLATMKNPSPAADDLHASDYSRLHEEVFRPTFDAARETQVIAFEHAAAVAIETVALGTREMAFIMRPMELGPFERIVSEGQRLPPKSTFFHPKGHTGTVIQSLKGTL